MSNLRIKVKLGPFDLEIEGEAENVKEQFSQLKKEGLGQIRDQLVPIFAKSSQINPSDEQPLLPSKKPGTDEVRKSEDQKPKRKQSSSRKTSTTRKHKVRPEIESLSVPVEFGDNPNYFDLKNNGQKLLYLLAYAHSQGISGLRPLDFQVLSVKLTEKISSSNVNGSLMTFFKKGYFRKENDGMRVIEHDGLKYLKKLKADEKNPS